MNIALRSLLILLLASTTFAAAADKGTAVFDLDRAAEELNILADIARQLEDQGKEINTELQKEQQALLTQLQGMQKLVGASPTDAQRSQLAQGASRLDAEMNLKRVTARTQLEARQNELIQEFTASIKPIALTVAQDAGYQAVSLKQTLFTFDPQIEITDVVIEAATKAGLKREAQAPAVEKKASEKTEPKESSSKKVE